MVGPARPTTAAIQVLGNGLGSRSFIPSIFVGLLAKVSGQAPLFRLALYSGFSVRRARPGMLIAVRKRSISIAGPGMKALRLRLFVLRVK